MMNELCDDCRFLDSQLTAANATIAALTAERDTWREAAEDLERICLTTCVYLSQGLGYQPDFKSLPAVVAAELNRLTAERDQLLAHVRAVTLRVADRDKTIANLEAKQVTDAEIVRTLAEFMGWERAPSNRLVLTSYDAVAEVWQRVQEADPYVVLPAADKGIPYNWFDHTPREHAEALASAIVEAKQ